MTSKKTRALNIELLVKLERKLISLALNGKDPETKAREIRDIIRSSHASLMLANVYGFRDGWDEGYLEWHEDERENE